MPHVGHAIEFFQADAYARYFHEREPWRQEIDESTTTLNNIAHLVRRASELYEPIIPDGAARAIRAIEEREKVILFPKL